MIQCKNSDCREELKPGKRKYCSDKCQVEHYETKRNLEKKALRKQARVVKFCKYEECGKQLPKDAHAQKEYCPSTKCAYKQNQLDAKRKRAEQKKNKKVVTIKCWNDYCNESFEQKHHKQTYCSKSCRNAQNQRDHKERLLTEHEGYSEAKKQALIENGSRKKLVIPDEYLTRGVEFTTKKTQDKKRKENKHFSAKWLENLWNNRDNAKILSCN